MTITNNAALPDDDPWTFEKIIKNRQVKWLGEQPSVQTARVIVYFSDRPSGESSNFW